MNTRPVSIITKLWLISILVLALLVWDGVAGADTTMQLTKMVGRRSLSLKKVIDMRWQITLNHLNRISVDKLDRYSFGGHGPSYAAAVLARSETTKQSPTRGDCFASLAMTS